jgi:hypothetical protein
LDVIYLFSCSDAGKPRQPENRTKIALKSQENRTKIAPNGQLITYVTPAQFYLGIQAFWICEEIMK